MVSPPRVVPVNMQQLASTSDRPICYEVKQQNDPVCVTSPRPPGLGSQCTQPTMGGSGLICLKISSHSGQSGGETAGLPMQENQSDCSRVAQHALVLGFPSACPTSLTLLTQPFSQIPHRNLTNLNLHA